MVHEEEWSSMNEEESSGGCEFKKWSHHKHERIKDHQCTSVLVKRICAPVHVVWSLVRRFDEPQMYKPFVQRCKLVHEEEEGTAEKSNIIGVGCKRHVTIISGLPATSSLEVLEILDDTHHVFSYRILGGDHRLKNYWSIITLHPEAMEGKAGTLAIESYVVDIPEGNNREETRFFVEALIKCNLKSLADTAERLALQEQSAYPI